MNQVKKGAIIELFEHTEVLIDMCSVLQELTQELWIFTTNNVYASLQPISLHVKLNWKLKQQNQSLKAFFHEHEEEISTCDLIFLLTTNIPFSDYSRLQFLNKSVLLIHNVHTFLQSHRHIAWSKLFRSDLLLRIVRFYLLGEYFYLRRLMQNTFVWAFPSETVLKYAVSKGLIPASQHAMFLPLGIFQSTRPVKEKSNPLRICIPGTIKSLGRDYRLVYRAFLQLLPKIDIQIELLLLGRPRGRFGLDIQESFMQLQNEFSHFHVRVFQKTLEQKEYDSQLKKTDFLIIPVTPLKRYDAFCENLGYSTISGAMHDMTRFGIPAIIPAFYPLESLHELLVKRFKDEEDLLKILFSWITSKRYKELRYNYYRQENAHKERRKSWATQFLMLRDVSKKQNNSSG